MTQATKYVTQEDCAAKLHIPKWVIALFFTIFLAVMGLFLTLVGMSALSANAAAASSTQAAANVEQALDKAEVVANSLNTHKQVSAMEKKAIIDKLEDIRKELYEHRQEQKLIMEKLIKLETRYYESINSKE